MSKTESAEAGKSSQDKTPRGPQLTVGRRLLRFLWAHRIYLPFLVLAVAALGQLYQIFLLRITYPLDLEWMEGGTLVHALRLMDGRPLYAPPSVEFVSFLYTPGYPAVVAALARVFGLSYFLGRFLSVVSFTAAFVVLVFWVRSTAKVYDDKRLEPLAWTAGLLSCAAVAMAYPFCGQWYDLVRADSLWLGLVAGGAFVLRPRGLSWGRVVAGALLLSAAFFTKQTAGPFMVAVAVGMALTAPWRKTVAYVGLASAICVGFTWWGNHITDGWFWIYIYELHQSHKLFEERLWVETPLKLLRWGAPLWSLVAVWPLSSLARRWVSKGGLYTFLLAGCGLATAAVGSATQGAYDNAHIPAVFFSALMAAVATVDLAGSWAGAGREGAGREGGAGFLERLWGSSRESPGAVEGRATTRAARWRGVVVGLAGLGLLSGQVVATWFSPQKTVPSADQVNQAQRLVSYLKTLGPKVFVPYHPFYNVIAGGRGHLHIMGYNDAYSWAKSITGDRERDRSIKARFRRSVRESFRERRWSVVIHDRTFTHQLPGLRWAYEKKEDLAQRGLSPPTLTGNPCRPRYLWLPR